MCKSRKTNFKTYALCFSECVKIAGKELKRMNTLTIARRTTKPTASTGYRSGATASHGNGTKVFVVRKEVVAFFVK